VCDNPCRCYEGGRPNNHGDKLCNNQAACFVGHTESVPRVNPAPGAPSQPGNINRPLLENAQTKKDLSLGVVANLASSCKDSSHNRHYYIAARGGCP
jgi:hypothetical protein